MSTHLLTPEEFDRYNELMAMEPGQRTEAGEDELASLLAHMDPVRIEPLRRSLLIIPDVDFNPVHDLHYLCPPGMAVKDVELVVSRIVRRIKEAAPDEYTSADITKALAEKGFDQVSPIFSPVQW